MREAGLTGLAARLARAGCVAAPEEADEITAAAGGDRELLEQLVRRREAGEPLAWVTGSTTFCGREVAVAHGVFVPRRQSEALVRRASALLPPGGSAIDLCTGAGALALALAAARPDARVAGVDRDMASCRCAATNGVAVVVGDLAAALAGRVELVMAVAPYVPTAAIALLPSDARDHEPRLALDGGEDGLAVLRRVVEDAARLLGRGGHLLLECGAKQADGLVATLLAAGFERREVLVDEEGDERGLVALRS